MVESLKQALKIWFGKYIYIQLKHTYVATTSLNVLLCYAASGKHFRLGGALHGALFCWAFLSEA
jgi:hypothetical protein